MAGMIGDTRINLQQDAMTGYQGLFNGIAEMPDDPKPIVLNTTEKLLMQLLEKIDRLQPTIIIGR